MNASGVEVQAVGQAPGTVVVAVNGAFDVASLSVAAFREATDQLVEGPTRHVVINLSGITELDSRGIGAVVFAVSKLRRAGVETWFVAPRPDMFRAFEVAGVVRMLTVHQTEEEALQAILDRLAKER